MSPVLGEPYTIPVRDVSARLTIHFIDSLHWIEVWPVRGGRYRVELHHAAREPSVGPVVRPSLERRARFLRAELAACETAIARLPGESTGPSL